jgi:dihydropteroate synthase
LETAQPCLVGLLDHAAYLGREFTRAEIALLSDAEYIQD